MKQKLFTTLLAAAVFSATTISAFAVEANPNADRAAYDLLKKAYDSRQTLPADFAGFDATVVYQEGPKTATGTLRFRSDGSSVFEIAGLPEADVKWLRHNALSISNHRRQGDFNETEGKYPLSFGDGDDTGFGKLIRRNDAQNLSSRVRDGKILELTRTGGPQRFIISVLETMQCDPGKYVPTRYIVSYVDPKTEALLKVETFENSYAKIDGLWLPVARKVISADPSAAKGLRMRSFQFKDIKIVR